MTSKLISDYFQISDPLVINTSTIDFQHYSYRVQDPNQRGRIEIDVHNTSRYYLPSEAFLEVEGNLRNYLDPAAPVDFGDNDNVGLVNNAIMALFDGASYLIDNRIIEDITTNIDIATTVIGLSRYSDDYMRTVGPSMLFSKDTSDSANNNPFISLTTPLVTTADQPADTTKYEAKETAATFDILKKVNEKYNAGYAELRKMMSGATRTFSAVIPLSHMFGFCRDHRKVIFGCKHTLALVRRQNDEAAVWTTMLPATAIPRVTLTKILLWMPAVKPSMEMEKQLLDFMGSERRIGIGYYSISTDTITSPFINDFSWHLSARQGIFAPRHVFITFQRTDRVNTRMRSHMIFDNLGVTEISLMINSQREPTESISINFDNAQKLTSRAYNKLLRFDDHLNNVDTGFMISQKDFNTLYPIFYFSLEHLDLLKQSIVDIHVHARLTPPADNPPTFRVVATILSLKSMTMAGTGGKMMFIDEPFIN